MWTNSLQPDAANMSKESATMQIQSGTALTDRQPQLTKKIYSEPVKKVHVNEQKL
jgi:hypothetical protein